MDRDAVSSLREAHLAAEAAPPLHVHRIRLGYGDTDPAGILYYAAWFPRMENLQTEFLFLQGLRQDTLVDRFGWWTVSRATACDYLAAARLLDEIVIELRLGAIGRSSFTFVFTMRRVDDDVIVARASNTVVTVDPDQASIPVPEGLRARLEPWLAVSAA